MLWEQKMDCIRFSAAMLVETCLKSGQWKGLFSQKACLVKKSIWPISLFGWKVSSATSQFSLQPHSHTPTPSRVSGRPYLPLTSFKNVLLDGIVTAIISALPAEPPSTADENKSTETWSAGGGKVVYLQRGRGRGRTFSSMGFYWFQFAQEYR